LSYAVKQKLLAYMPTFPKVKVPLVRPQPVPAESFESLYSKATDLQMKAYLLCGWRAGLRLNEGFELEWEETSKAPWLDFARKRIWIPASFSKAVADQWLPLDSVLQEALQALPRKGRKVFRFEKRRGSGLLTVQGLGQRVCRLAQRAGVKLTMKSLRRGFGCYFANRESAHVLQRLMRHASITTTLNYYVNCDAAVEQAVLSRNDQLADTSCNATCSKTAFEDTEPESLSGGNPDRLGT
jgi:integrase